MKVRNICYKAAGLLIMTVLGVIGFSACAATKTPAGLTPVTFQLSWTHLSQFAGFYAAYQKGYYADEGLNVTFLEGGQNVDRWKSVLDGTAQFGIAGADEIILARSEGKPVRAISTIYRRSPVVFIALSGSGIKSPKDFVGIKIRTTANTIATLHSMTEQVGVSPNQYTEVANLPSDLDMFLTGEFPVWGVYVNGLVISAEQAGYQLNKIYPDDFGVHFYADTIFTTNDRIANNPDLVTRFVRASLKGWTYAVENPSEVPAMVQKVSPNTDAALELARMTSTLALVNTGEDHIGWMKPEIWSSMERTLRVQGLLAQPLDVTQVYTMQFLDEIYPSR
jgi:NitT/TauT family transport system substrate-binding protein